MWDSALREGLLFVFQGIFASINEIFILAGGLAAGVSSMEFLGFPDIA